MQRWAYAACYPDTEGRTVRLSSSGPLNSPSSTRSQCIAVLLTMSPTLLYVPYKQ